LEKSAEKKQFIITHTMPILYNHFCFSKLMLGAFRCVFLVQSVPQRSSFTAEQQVEIIERWWTVQRLNSDKGE